MISFSFQRELASPANATVKALVRLHVRRHRRSSGTMLVDGVRPCLTALRSGCTSMELYVCPELLNQNDPELGELATEITAAGVPTTSISKAVADKIACRENSDGIIATAQTLERPLSAFAAPDSPLLLVIEGVEKPGNLGAMLRTADGAGIDGVIVCDPVTDLGNPNVIRASMGTVFSVPLAVADAATAKAWLRAENVTIVAATPEAKTAYWNANFQGGAAIVVGAEHAGLSADWRVDDTGLIPVSIPMRGQADSLNVATAAALMIYEALRQRS